MKGSGSSSSPTATAVTGGANSQREARGAGGPDLQEMAQNWPTPMAGTPAQNGNNAAGNNDFSRRAEKLAQAVMWGTPSATLQNYDENPEAYAARKAQAGINLGQRAQMWYTPDVPNGGRAMPKGMTLTGRKADGTKGQVGLENQAKMWTTPQAHDVTMRGSGQVPTSKAGNACLARDAANWPTPASRGHKGENSAAHLTNGTGRLHLDQLPNFVAHIFSQPDPTTWMPGELSSQATRNARRLYLSATSRLSPATLRRLSKPENFHSRRLNPNFVEWLMGWPPGHALCDCSETEWFLWKRRMRGALSRLRSASAGWIWVPQETAPEPNQMGFDL